MKASRSARRIAVAPACSGGSTVNWSAVEQTNVSERVDLEPPIRTFARGDDAAYQRWVDDHGGYVLVKRPDGFMLHQARCSHLDLTPGRWTLTARPRRWAKGRQPLVQWAQKET